MGRADKSGTADATPHEPWDAPELAAGIPYGAYPGMDRDTTEHLTQAAECERQAHLQQIEAAYANEPLTLAAALHDLACVYWLAYNTPGDQDPDLVARARDLNRRKLDLRQNALDCPPGDLHQAFQRVVADGCGTESVCRAWIARARGDDCLAVAHNAFAYSLWHQGRDVDAIAAAETALQLAHQGGDIAVPEVIDSIELLSRIEFWRKNFARAAELCRQGLDAYAPDRSGGIIFGRISYFIRSQYESLIAIGREDEAERGLRQVTSYIRNLSAKYPVFFGNRENLLAGLDRLEQEFRTPGLAASRHLAGGALNLAVQNRRIGSLP